jgi:hypothetical protein
VRARVIPVEQSFNGDYIMNVIYIIARLAQTLLALGIVAGSALIFQYGYAAPGYFVI